MNRILRREDWKGKRFYRDMALVIPAAKKTASDGQRMDAEDTAAEEDNREVELSFSSAEPYGRWFGIEVLDHSAGSVRMGRLDNGAAVLINHDASLQVGVVEDAKVAGGKGRARIRFSRSVLGSEVLQDVRDGIRRNVSVGYEIHEMVLEEKRDDGEDVYRVTDWEPLEVSIVAVPADSTVGVGRVKGERGRVKGEGGGVKGEGRGMEKVNRRSIKGIGKMDEDVKVDVQAVKDEAKERFIADQAKRVSEIQTVVRAFPQYRKAADKALLDNVPADVFRQQVMEGLEKDGLVRKVDAGVGNPGLIGLDGKEQKRYSLLRAIKAAADNDWSKAGYERELSQEVASRLRRSATGFYVPDDVFRRDLTTTSGGAGGYLVGTDVATGEFVDLLRNRMVVQQLGARVLDGLVGDVAIPKQTAGSTMYWVDPDSDPTESTPALGQIGLTPKTAGAFVDIRRSLLLQSSMSVESMVQDDLVTTVALGIDLATINGSGAGAEPLGILNRTGVTTVSLGTNGAAPTWAKIVDMETQVAALNADTGTMAYLFNSAGRGKLKTVEKASSTAQFIWSDGPESPVYGLVNGYRAANSNQVPSDLAKGSGTNLSAAIFGNFGSLVIGMWGGTDVTVNPYKFSESGTIRVSVLKTVDVALRHNESFSKIVDMITT